MNARAGNDIHTLHGAWREHCYHCARLRMRAHDCVYT
jgi:hypothetical protein